MRLVELGLLYGLIGLGCAVATFVRSPSDRPGRVTDAVLVAGLWPVYGPFLLLQGRVGFVPLPGDSEEAFLAALRRARGTPLSVLLPDETQARALAARLRVAAGKVTEIDALLRSPEFSEREALERQRELEGKGASECALSTSALRVQNIRRLKALRDRFARELDEVGELLIQLRTQADLVRIAGGPDPGSRDLVDEIISRVEGLDRMIDDGAPSCPAPPSPPGGGVG